MLGSRSRFLFEGVIGRADERAGFDVLETHLFAEALVLREFIRMNEAHDRQMLARGLEILAERENVDALASNFLHGTKNFVALFAEAEHHARFRGHRGRHLFGAAQQFKRTFVD